MAVRVMFDPEINVSLVLYLAIHGGSGTRRRCVFWPLFVTDRVGIIDVTLLVLPVFPVFPTGVPAGFGFALLPLIPTRQGGLSHSSSPVFFSGLTA